MKIQSKNPGSPLILTTQNKDKISIIHHQPMTIFFVDIKSPIYINAIKFYSIHIKFTIDTFILVFAMMSHIGPDCLSASIFYVKN